MSTSAFTGSAFAESAVTTPVSSTPAATAPESSSDASESAAFSKLQKRLRRNLGQAISDFNMIEDGDRIMVCLSGGKDSYAMLDMLLNLKVHAPIKFDIIAVNLDQKQPGFPEHVLPTYLTELGVEYKIVEEDTYSIVMDKVQPGKTTCSLCSRLRRGILYRTATELGATKIALGHHRDDILETLMLNMFYAGTMKSMPPKLVSDNGQHVVIRPLAYCKEQDIIAFAKAKEFPIIPCNLCGSQENLQRQNIKAMLEDWDQRFPGRIASMFRSLQNVVPSHLLDHQQFDFKNITRESGVIDGGDIGFDKPEVPSSFVDDEQTAPELGERLSIMEVK